MALIEELFMTKINTKEIKIVSTSVMTDADMTAFWEHFKTC